MINKNKTSLEIFKAYNQELKELKRKRRNEFLLRSFIAISLYFVAIMLMDKGILLSIAIISLIKLGQLIHEG